MCREVFGSSRAPSTPRGLTSTQSDPKNRANEPHAKDAPPHLLQLSSMGVQPATTCAGCSPIPHGARMRAFLLAPKGISQQLFRCGRKQLKVWNQIEAFFFEQSHIGAFQFPNWMLVLGVPAFILFLWMMESHR